jgi:hypothetical protein
MGSTSKYGADTRRPLSQKPRCRLGAIHFWLVANCLARRAWQHRKSQGHQQAPTMEPLPTQSLNPAHPGKSPAVLVRQPTLPLGQAEVGARNQSLLKM